jgi:hypothetical protein
MALQRKSAIDQSGSIPGVGRITASGQRTPSTGRTYDRTGPTCIDHKKTLPSGDLRHMTQGECPTRHPVRNAEATHRTAGIIFFDVRPAPA